MKRKHITEFILHKIRQATTNNYYLNSLIIANEKKSLTFVLQICGEMRKVIWGSLKGKKLQQKKFSATFVPLKIIAKYNQ